MHAFLLACSLVHLLLTCCRCTYASVCTLPLPVVLYFHPTPTSCCHLCGFSTFPPRCLCFSHCPPRPLPLCVCLLFSFTNLPWRTLFTSSTTPGVGASAYASFLPTFRFFFFCGLPSPLFPDLRACRFSRCPPYVLLFSALRCRPFFSVVVRFASLSFTVFFSSKRLCRPCLWKTFARASCVLPLYKCHGRYFFWVPFFFSF